MFGMAAPLFGILPGDNDPKGDQVRGFGFLHDGSFDTLFRFFRGMGFSPFTGFTNQFGTFPDNPNGLPDSPAGDAVRRQLESFLLAFDSNVAPIVGQQVALTSGNQAAAVRGSISLIARADAGAGVISWRRAPDLAGDRLSSHRSRAVRRRPDGAATGPGRGCSARSPSRRGDPDLHVYAAGLGLPHRRRSIRRGRLPQTSDGAQRR